VDTIPKVMVGKFSTITIHAHTVYTQMNENENKRKLTNILTKDFNCHHTTHSHLSCNLLMFIVPIIVHHPQL
jgi:hypothetical protein